MTISLSHPRALSAGLALLTAVHIAPDVSAQTNGAKAAPTAKVVVLPVALYNAQANVQEPSDTAQARLSTEVLTGKLQELLGEQLDSPAAGNGSRIVRQGARHHGQPAVQRDRRLRPPGGKLL